MAGGLGESSDSETATELAEIIARLAALHSEPPTAKIAEELRLIRASLQHLAADNAEMARLLGNDKLAPPGS